MQAVESMQKANTRRKKTLGGPEGKEEASARQPSLSMPTTPTLTPAGGARGFRPSETSAFSRPSSRASLKACSPLPLPINSSPLSTSLSTPPSTRPKPPSRSSSLQKISSGYNSPAQSSPSLSGKEQGSLPPSSIFITASPNVHTQAQLKLKYPTSPYTAHISPSHSSSNISISPICGNPSPVGSTPSPALSYSSAGSVSASSSPANTPELNQSKRAALDTKVQAIHNLKTFWANASLKHEVASPGSLLRGGNKKMSKVQNDVLGLLNLSPRHESVCKNVEGTQDHSTDDRPNGHQKLEVQPPPSPSSSLPKNSKGGSHNIRQPSGNGYKFLSAGHFFPSSKC